MLRYLPVFKFYNKVKNLEAFFYHICNDICILYLHCSISCTTFVFETCGMLFPFFAKFSYLCKSHEFRVLFSPCTQEIPAVTLHL